MCRRAAGAAMPAACQWTVLNGWPLAAERVGERLRRIDPGRRAALAQTCDTLQRLGHALQRLGGDLTRRAPTGAIAFRHPATIVFTAEWTTRRIGKLVSHNGSIEDDRRTGSGRAYRRPGCRLSRQPATAYRRRQDRSSDSARAIAGRRRGSFPCARRSRPPDRARSCPR